MTEIIPTNNNGAELVQADRLPLDQNPAAVYLAALNSETGRRSQRQALDKMAELMSGGAANCLSFPWQNLRYQHTAAIRAKLIDMYAPATCNKFLSALRGVLLQAFTLGQIGAEDYQRAVLVKSVTGERIPAGRSLSTGEIGAIMAACESDITPAGVRDAAIFSLMLAALLRREEVVRLDLENYDPETGLLVVLGKRNKQRTDYIDNGAYDALADWLEVRGNEPGPLFYPVNKGGKITRRRMTNRAVYNMLEKRGDQAGVKKFTPHDTRRTTIGDLLDAGVDISTVAKMAGHSNVQTTARYDRRGEQAKKKAAGVIHVPYHRRNKLPGA